MPSPNPPTNLVCTNGGANDIVLAWTDNSSDETGFRIERKLGVSGSYSEIDTVGANVTGYVDTSSKTANRPYIYRVRAYNGSGNSAYSNEDDATTPYAGTVPNYKTDTANYVDVEKTITDATNATPIVITTSTTHGLSTGDLIRISKVLGNDAANGLWRVTVLSTTTFSLDNSVGTGAFSSSPAARVFANFPVPLPLAGGKFYDEMFGTQVMRFTDESDGDYFGTAYSVWPTFNCDNTRVYLQSGGGWALGEFNPTTFRRSGALHSIPNAPFTNYAHYESAFWSFTDPNKLFILVDAKIYYYSPLTDTYTLVKDLQSYFGAGWFFNQLYVSSNDNRFGFNTWNGSGNQGFAVYELSTDTLKLDVRNTDVNGITMDKSGQYVLFVTDSLGYYTQYIYSVDAGTFETLISDVNTGLPDFGIGHNDAGQSVIVGADQWNGGFSFRNMGTPHTVSHPFTYAPYWFNFHLSMRADNDEWVLVGTYGDTGVSAAPPKYYQELFQTNNTNGSLRRLVHGNSNYQANVFLCPTCPVTVTGATNATPIVIATSGPHRMLTGMRPQISGIGGNTAANGTWTATVIDATHFSLDGSTGNGAYTSGGQVYAEMYWDTPRANMSRDGKFIAWTSNWNGVPGGGRRDLFIAQVDPVNPSASPSPSASLSPSASASPSAGSSLKLIALCG